MTAAAMNIQMVGSDETLLENMVMDLKDRLPADENLTVVSIIGRQNTGKSHLLNCLFGTDFNVLDSQENYGQTTRGIWIAQCPTNPSIVVIDIEGSDSSTNAQNGTSFANRAALFALTISDVLLLNMEAKGLGQYEGGCLPLLQTIFRERISLPRLKTRVEVTLRDCRNLTNDKDKVRAEEIIKECWNSGPATNGRLEESIEVSVVTFPNATDSGQAIQNEFQSKVAQLREKLTGFTPTQSRDTFLNNVLTIWPEIRSNEDLNIPSFNKTLSTHRCNTIMQQELSSLDSNKEFSQLRDMKDTTSSEWFQRSLAEFLTSTLDRFDESADRSIPEVRDDIKAKLQQEIIKKLEEKFSSILRTETSKKVEEKKKLISSDLRAMKKDIVSSTLTCALEAFESNIDVDSIVNAHVREFDQIFRGCREEYNLSVSLCRAEVVGTLKDYAKREIMEIKKLEEKFSSILWTETSKKVEQKKKLISSDLRAMKKGTVSSIFTLTFNLEAFKSNIDVDSIVEAHVGEFEQIFGGCCEEYYLSVSFCRARVVDTLKDYAEREIMKIKEFHKKVVSIGKGVLICIGVGASGYLVSCGASIILASFLPALAAWSKADRSKIHTLLECMLQNIIIPAAKISMQHTKQHMGKQMFNLSMTMVAFLLKIISDQRHAHVD